MRQKIEIIGNCGREPELRFTPSGQAVCNFSVAVNETFTSGNGERVKRTLWFRVQSWGKAAEIHDQYIKKGMLLFVEGRLVADPNTGGPKVFETKNGHNAAFEINAQEVKFLSRSEGGQVEAARELGGEVREIEDSDIPF